MPELQAFPPVCSPNSSIMQRTSEKCARRSLIILRRLKKNAGFTSRRRTILEVTELICQVMEEKGISRTELAKRLGKSKGYISQLLDGEANMTVRTISDVFTALGKGLTILAKDVFAEGEPDRVERICAASVGRRNASRTVGRGYRWLHSASVQFVAARWSKRMWRSCCEAALHCRPRWRGGMFALWGEALSD